MKKIIFILLITGSLMQFTFAQVNNSAFISGSMGGYSSGSSNDYKPRNAPSIVLSTGFGLPLFNQVFLYTKLSYIAKSDYIAHGDYSIANSDFSTTNQLVQANASFSQLIFNGGLQYNIPLYDDLLFGLNGGFTYALVNHEAFLSNGSLIQRLDNEGVYGLFGGVSLEKSFEDSDFSLFGEAQYNYARKDVLYFRDKFSGMNFTVGGRFYLNSN